MKKWILNMCMAIAVMLITSTVVHLISTKDWETCFSAGVGAAVAMLLSTRWRLNNRKPIRQG